ncbi:MAG: InlB B-repeat-containing protein, partial [Candidatus Micrarchaeaceae archaeon]
MPSIRDEIFKILGYVPKSSCQSTTFEPTTIKDRIFLMLGYIPESQCIPITPITCPSGDVQAVNGQCPSGYTADPNNPGCCMPVTVTPPPITCPSGDVQAVNGQCPSGYTADPNNPGCCMPVTVTPPPITCPSGDVQAVNGQCPSGYTADPNNPGCCMPVTVTPPPITCPSGDVQAVNGQCPSGYTADPNNPGCCMPVTVTPPPITCPSGDVQAINGQCPSGYTADPNNPGCCMPVTPTITQYTINIVAGSGGSVSPSGTQTITSTSSPITVTATPNSGYQFTNWTIDSTNAGSNNPVNLSYSVLQELGLSPGNYTLTANFTSSLPPTVTSLNISASPSSGGTVYPTSISNITPSTSATITATPNSGYQFTGWTLNGTPLSITSSSLSLSQIFSLLQAGVNNLVANFSQIVTPSISLSISASPSNAGTVYPTSISNITSLTSATITATPNSGYQFTGWTLNGTPLSITSSSLSLSSIFSLLQTGINNLVANFKQVITTATLIVSAGAGGSVSNAGTYTLPPSFGISSATERVNMQISMPSGISRIHPVEYNIIFIETGLPSGTSWTVKLNGNTETSSSDFIIFQLPSGTYNFTISQVPGYIATPSSGTINVGRSIIRQYIKFTRTPITPPPTNQYVVNIVAGSGGSVSPSGEQTITPSSSPITVTATPNSGYQFSGWTIDSSNVGSNNPISLSYSILQGLGLTPGSYTLTANFTSSAVSSIVFTPQANSGYQFSNWTLNGTDITSYASSISGYPSLSINDVFNIIKQIISDWQGRTFNLVANFKAVQAQLPSLNISASPSNAGTVYPTSISNITPSTSATITATPNSGYQFTG